MLNVNSRKLMFEVGREVFRICVVLLCVVGFLYQSVEFLLLYWTYPTVVDIQESSPTHFDVPAITICNPIGYNYTALCSEFNQPVCTPPFIMKTAFEKFFCDLNPHDCVDDMLPSDLVVRHGFQQILVTLEDYMNCSIESNGVTTACNMENVMGSFYTKETLPQYCYTIYSIWGQPEKKRERIQKGGVIRLRFSLNASERSEVVPDYNDWGPRHNIPVSPYVQMAVHSPYFLPSPYLEGQAYIGGKAYTTRVDLDEKHLLPFPYRSNCTDYLAEWKKNGGKGPINQLGVVQRCRMRLWLEGAGCVPIDVDYPHTHSICGTDTAKNYKESVADHRCISLAEHYNQPCDYLSYHSIKKEVDIVVNKSVVIGNMTEVVETRIPGHHCKGNKVWRPECSLISINILFDRFKITKVQYNSKFEQLELFSAIGGYMGMWLGVSLVVIYDYIGAALVHVRTWIVKGRTKIRRSSVLTFTLQPEREAEY